MVQSIQVFRYSHFQPRTSRLILVSVETQVIPVVGGLAHSETWRLVLPRLRQAMATHMGAAMTAMKTIPLTEEKVGLQGVREGAVVDLCSLLLEIDLHIIPLVASL